MPKKKSEDKKKSEICILEESPVPSEPKNLPEDPIYFWTNIEEKEPKTVPPPTPKYISDVKTIRESIPKTFPKLDDFEVPYVREIGVKKCIEILGEYLGCKNYPFDYLQFWLLDILIDCLWRAQDEYHLNVREQKIVLEWVLYMIQIMTDKGKILSRKVFFNMFKEAILIAGDIINEGEADVPLPEAVFTDLMHEESEEMKQSDENTSENTNSTISSSSESSSTISISTYKSKNIVEMDVGEETLTYIVKKKVCDCKMDESVKSTLASGSTSSTQEISIEEELENTNMDYEGEEMLYEQKNEIFYEPVQVKDYKEFYIPDEKIPKRFLPLAEENSIDEIKEEEIRECEETLTEESSNTDKEDVDDSSNKVKKPRKFEVDFSYLDSSSNNLKNDTGIKSEDISITSETGKTSLSNTVILNQLARYKLWEQRLKDMDNPKIGWMSVDIDKKSTDKLVNSPNDTISDITDETITEEQEITDKKLICFGVLCTIVDFIFDYFYRSFHFTLMKLSTHASQNVIMQQLNQQWNVPKVIKQDLDKPKPPIKKKEKKKKEKSSKGSKKGKDKKSKKKSDKKSKKSSKSSKGGKKKKEKPKKLTKEEKAELERQRKMQEEIEAELRRLEENKRFMFPLTDAADDELFTGIFENWVKPKEKGKKGEKGKGKKKK